MCMCAVTSADNTAAACALATLLCEKAVKLSDFMAKQGPAHITGPAYMQSIRLYVICL
jgi:hypothetical protein